MIKISFRKCMYKCTDINLPVSSLAQRWRCKLTIDSEYWSTYLSRNAYDTCRNCSRAQSPSSWAPYSKRPCQPSLVKKMVTMCGIKNDRLFIHGHGLFEMIIIVNNIFVHSLLDSMSG